MNQSLELARQVAEDRRVRFTDRHPKTARNRHERRTLRATSRFGPIIADVGHGR